MDELKKVAKRATGLHQKMGNDLEELGGLLVCKKCGGEEVAKQERLAEMLFSGWKCKQCGGNLRWYTQKEIDEGSYP